MTIVEALQRSLLSGHERERHIILQTVATPVFDGCEAVIGPKTPATCGPRVIRTYCGDTFPDDDESNVACHDEVNQYDSTRIADLNNPGSIKKRWASHTMLDTWCPMGPSMRLLASGMTQNAKVLTILPLPTVQRGPQSQIAGVAA